MQKQLSLYKSKQQANKNRRRDRVDLEMRKSSPVSHTSLLFDDMNYRMRFGLSDMNENPAFCI